MKSKDFIRESELDQLATQYQQPTQKTGIVPRTISAIGKGIGGALNSTASAIANAPGTVSSRGSFYRPGTPLPGTTSILDRDTSNTDTVPSTGVAINRADITKMRNYAVQATKGEKAKNSTGTPEVDELLKQLGLM